MANCTVDFGMNPLLLEEFRANLFTRTLPFRRFPVKLRNELYGPNMRFWIAMAIDTPSHGQFLGLIHFLHCVDTTVAAYTTDATIDVR